ncbi:MAG: hypothetical protein ACXVJO_17255 [Thermoanaerobaculia bacterium]
MRNGVTTLRVKIALAVLGSAAFTSGMLGCGPPQPTTSSCVAATGGLMVCIEYYGTNPPAASECTGTVHEAPCTRTGAIGGCQLMRGADRFTTWYYNGDPSMVPTLCSAAGETFVSP